MFACFSTQTAKGLLQIVLQQLLLFIPYSLFLVTQIDVLITSFSLIFLAIYWDKRKISNHNLAFKI